jgi:hypothetical protein
VRGEVYDTLFPGARELRETFEYFEECFYFGPDREPRIAAAKALCPEGFIGFADWARINWTSTKRRGVTAMSKRGIRRIRPDAHRPDARGSQHGGYRIDTVATGKLRSSNTHENECKQNGGKKE